MTLSYTVNYILRSLKTMLSNNTNYFSIIKNLNESICNLSSSLCSPVHTCRGKPVHLAYISVICVVGVVSNVLLLYANYKEWKKSKTSDKVLIFNLAIANLAALVVSLPFHAIVVTNYQDYLRSGCVWPLYRRYLDSAQSFSMNLCNFVTVATLLVVGIDRYEALTKFSHQRTLSVKKSILIIGLEWIFSTAIVVVLNITTTPSSKGCTEYFSKSEDIQTSRLFSIKVIVKSIWITLCVTLSATSLLLAAKKIRKHRQEINDKFGIAQATREISFTKSAVALLLCYMLLWLPYGISSTILFSDKNNSKLICAKSWTVTTCYFSFGVLPGIYFIVDSRLRRAVLPQTQSAPVAMTTRGNGRTN